MSIWADSGAKDTLKPAKEVVSPIRKKKNEPLDIFDVIRRLSADPGIPELEDMLEANRAAFSKQRTLDVLDSFLACNCKVDAAATASHVSRNTVSKHLLSFYEETGIDVRSFSGACLYKALRMAQAGRDESRQETVVYKEA